MQRLEERGKSQHRSALRRKSYGRAGRHGPIELFGTQQHTTGLVYLFLVWRLYEWKTAEKPNPPIPIAGMGFSHPRRGGRRKTAGAVSGVVPDSEGCFMQKPDGEPMRLGIEANAPPASSGCRSGRIRRAHFGNGFADARSGKRSALRLRKPCPCRSGRLPTKKGRSASDLFRAETGT